MEQQCELTSTDYESFLECFLLVFGLRVLSVRAFKVRVDLLLPGYLFTCLHTFLSVRLSNVFIHCCIPSSFP